MEKLLIFLLGGLIGSSLLDLKEGFVNNLMAIQQFPVLGYVYAVLFASILLTLVFGKKLG